jgi:ferredoxin
LSKNEDEIRSIAKRLLEEKRVELVIGYEAWGGGVRPCFITRSEDVNRLVWNDECWFNLARYLRGFKGRRVGIVVKGCDGRSIVELVKENQVNRADLIIIAVECNGVRKPVRYGSSRVSDSVSEYCARCEMKTSPLWDFLVKSTEHNRSEKVFEKEVSDWFKTFSKCLKCIACIKVCPFCYCTECIVEGFKPMLVSKLRRDEEVFTFHLTRAIHMAGRCVECGACEAACPVEIPLTKLYRELNQWFKENYAYIPGRSLDENPPPIVFKEDVER